MPAFEHAAFVRLVADLGVTYFFTVPPIYAALVKDPAVTHQLARVRAASGGAAPMSLELQQAASAKLAPDATVFQVWGLTETTGSVTRRLPDRETPVGSLGCLMPNVSMRLVDDDGRDVAVGRPGEALLRGPTITRGYHNNPDANRAAFTADGWFRTGDILRVDNGLLYIVDRKKELIKYKGLQVAPAELEGVLLDHPAVADAAVVGIARHDTEVPRALVVRAPAARVSEADLAAFVRARVAAYKQLRGGVVFVDRIPRNLSGKILRKELRSMAQEQAKL